MHSEAFRPQRNTSTILCGVQEPQTDSHKLIG